MRCVNCHREHDHHCPEGFNVLNHLPLIKMLTKRYLGAITDIEDVIQDALLYLWENKHKYNAELGRETTFTYWGVRVVVQNRRRQQTNQEEFFDDMHGYTDSKFQSIELKEQADILLRKLTTDYQRETIHLLFYEGLTMKEAAGRLDVPLATIKGRQQAAINTMRY